MLLPAHHDRLAALYTAAFLMLASFKISHVTTATTIIEASDAQSGNIVPNTSSSWRNFPLAFEKSGTYRSVFIYPRPSKATAYRK